ncbi:uncharacterized protein N7483_009915 [Penicillium malachiteum]|uniref:uncharacterized protein n=1 Tax=Penicillium malachiteum TaxID=1324776 RepID=UPI002547E430|nr:uncharacterized protein N7483_009915 [Penicillium malachiteum]KAJ5718833.1 hypothetical protein N7483_009915 [Penicillium malachiteum]
MNASGIDYAIVSLTCPGMQGILDTGEAVELARKTNDAIHEHYVKAHPTRFGYFASVAMQNPEEAAKELECAVTVLGAKGVLINGFTNIDKINLSQAAYGFGVETAGHTLHIMCSGVFDRYPVSN